MSLWFRLFLTIAIQALAALAAVSPAVVAPVALKDLGLGSEAWLGIYIALLYLAAMVSTLISGDSITRLGPIRVSQIGLVACAIGISIIILGQPWLLILAPCLNGFGYGLITPAGSQILMTDGAPRSIGLIFSIKQTGVPLGGVLAGLIVPFLVDLSNWRLAMLAVVGFCSLTTFCAQFPRARLDRGRDVHRRIVLKQISSSLTILRANPAAFRLASAFFFYAAMQLCVITFLVSYLTHGFSMSLIAAGLLMSVAQVGEVTGRIFWGWLTDFAISTKSMLVFLAIVMAPRCYAAGIFERIGILADYRADSFRFRVDCDRMERRFSCRDCPCDTAV